MSVFICKESKILVLVVIGSISNHIIRLSCDLITRVPWSRLLLIILLCDTRLFSFMRLNLSFGILENGRFLQSVNRCSLILIVWNGNLCSFGYREGILGITPDLYPLSKLVSHIRCLIESFKVMVVLFVLWRFAAPHHSVSGCGAFIQHAEPSEIQRYRIILDYWHLRKSSLCLFWTLLFYFVDFRCRNHFSAALMHLSTILRYAQLWLCATSLAYLLRSRCLLPYHPTVFWKSLKHLIVSF